MNRNYHRWRSPRLDRDMELLVFGHAGARVLVFPSRCNRFYEYENRGMVRVLSEHITQGRLQLFCVDGIDEESFYCFWAHPKGRLTRHLQFEQYILEEVIPFSRDVNPHPFLIAHGCSLGAFHAMNIALRHPSHFGKVIAFSGRYDLTRSCTEFNDLFNGYYDEDVYFNTPTHYMPNLTDEGLLEQIRRLEIIMTIGNEDPFYGNTREFSDVLLEKQIPHALHVWNGRAHRFSDWRQMARHYI